MENEKIEIMLKKLNCSIYKLNKENGIIEKSNGGGSSTVGVKEIVDITTELSSNGIRFIIVNNDDIQIEQ